MERLRDPEVRAALDRGAKSKESGILRSLYKPAVRDTDHLYEVLRVASEIESPLLQRRQRAPRFLLVEEERTGTCDLGVERIEGAVLPELHRQPRDGDHGHDVILGDGGRVVVDGDISGWIVTGLLTLAVAGLALILAILSGLFIGGTTL